MYSLNISIQNFKYNVIYVLKKFKTYKHQLQKRNTNYIIY